MPDIPPATKALRQQILVGLVSFSIGFSLVFFGIFWLVRKYGTETHWWEWMHMGFNAILISVFGGLVVVWVSGFALSIIHRRIGYCRCPNCQKDLEHPGMLCECQDGKAQALLESVEVQSGQNSSCLGAYYTPPRRILVRGVNWLGDAVMTTPALMRLREKFPAAHIALLTHEKLRDVYLHHPALNETITFSKDEGLFALGRRLRAGKFDLALVLPNSPRSAMEVWLARIPLRIGGEWPWRNWFLTDAIPARDGAVKMRKRTESEVRNLISAAPSPLATRHSPLAHHLHQYLHLVAALGADASPLPPNLAVTDEEIVATKKKFGLEDVSAPIFALNPGAEYGPAKRWPADNFIAAAREIQTRTNCHWLILGGKADMQTAEAIASAIGNRQSAITNVSGQTSLRELMALLELCRVLLTNDTGPMHVAAALGTPVVVPFGSTSPELTGPGLPGDTRHRLLKSDAPCSPCFLRECPIDFRCMNSISVERVVEALLQATRSSS